MSHFVIGRGQLLEIRDGRVYGTPPDLRSLRGWQLTRLRGHCRMQRVTLYTVVLPPAGAIAAELARMEAALEDAA